MPAKLLLSKEISKNLCNVQWMNSTEFPLIYSTHRKILSLMTVNKQLNYSDSK